MDLRGEALAERGQRSDQRSATRICDSQTCPMIPMCPLFTASVGGFQGRDYTADMGVNRAVKQLKLGEV